MKKKLISYLLILCLLCSLLPAAVFEAEAATYSGTCGDNLTWTLDTDTGELTISGTGAMTDYTRSSGGPWSSYLNYIKTVTIGNGVTSIGSYAFYNCSSLTSVTIPGSVTSIGSDAFSHCSSLTSVTIGDSVTSIGSWAFYNCSSLTSVMIPDSVTSIGSYAFYYCSSLTSATIPDSVTSIGSDAFSHCSSLTSVTIPDSVTSIGSYTFDYCSSLTSVTIGDSVTSIGYYAFRSCSSLTSVTISGSVTSIGSCAFYYCSSLTSVTIPGSVTSIGSHAFRSCSSLTSVTILNQECSIYSYAYTLGVAGTTVIYGYEGSTAQTYAEKYGYTFVPLGENTAWGGGSVYDQATGELTLTVQVNQKKSNQTETKYQLADSATVEYQGTAYALSAEDNGQLKLAYTGGSVTVSKDGYVSRTYSEGALKNSATVYLQKTSENYPVISGLWMNDVDIMNEACEIPLTDSGSYTVTPEIDWGENAYDSVKICQGSNSVEITDGVSTVNWSESVDISEDVYLVATNASGICSKKKLQIEVASSSPDALEGFSYNWGSKLSITLPENIAFFGGQKISVGLPVSIPVEYSVENGKVYVAIGYQSNGSYDKDSGSMKAKDFAKSAKNIFQSAKNGLSDYGVYQRMNSRLGKNMFKGAGSFGFDGDFTIAGFMEGYLTPEGKVQWLESGMLIGCGVSVSYSFPFYAGPVPLFFEASLSASVEAKANLMVNDAIDEVTPDGRISGEVALSGGVGLGIKKVISVSGGLEGKLMPYWEYSFGATDYFRLNASLSAYAKAELLCFTYKHTWDPITEAVWYEYPATKGQKADAADTAVEEFNPYDIAAYSVQDLSYLEETSEFMPSDISKKSLSTENVSVTDFLTNAYIGADPRIVSFSDGSMLAVWVGSNGDSSVNSLQLFASYFNGEIWSSPIPVEDDGTADAAPNITVIDDTAYLVWQDASEAVAEDISLDNFASKMDLSFAKYERATNSFSVSAITENSGTLNMLPVICGEGDSVAVVWLNNGENDWFGSNAVNQILCRSFDGSQWSDTQTLYGDLSSIDSLAASYDGGVLNVAYSMDTDGDIATDADMEIYLNGTALTENVAIDSGVAYSSGQLYWYQDGALINEDGVVINNLSTDRYQVIDENGVRAIIYNQYNGLYSAIFAVFFDSGSKTWGEPVALTGNSASYKSFDTILDPNGSLHIFANQISVADGYESDDPYGEATLQLITAPLACDLEVLELYYDGSAYVEAADMTFDLVVRNNGEVAASGLLAVITDESGAEIGRTVFGSRLLPGVSTEITCGFAAETVQLGQTVTITVTPLNEADSYLMDNCATAVLDFSDVTVENVAWGLNISNEAVIYADIVNRSYAVHNEAVTVSLRDSTVDGTVVQTKTISCMEALGVERSSFVVAYEEGKVYYITIEAANQNENLANDADFVVLQTTSCLHEYAAASTSATCTEAGYTTYMCSLCGDSYTDDVIAALGHSYVYTDNGDDHTITCANGCDHSVTEAHSYTDYLCACGAVDPYAGLCGENVRWTVDVTTGQLTISGTGAMANYTSSKLVPWYDYRTLIISIVMEEGVTTVGDYVFRNLDGVTSMVIPDSVTTIGVNAFSHCSNLESIQLSENLTKIGNSAFRDCTALASVSIPESVTSISDYAFYTSGLTSVTIPGSVTSISYGAFSACSSLTEVTICSGVTSIGYGAFSNCGSLTSVTIPDSVTVIDSFAFARSNSLKSVTIPGSVTSIGDSAFYSAAGLGHVHFLGDMPVLGTDSFAECSADLLLCYPAGVQGWEACTYAASSAEYSYSTSATCTENGVQTVTCSCGELLKSTEVNATGHSYSYTDNGDNHTVTCANGCDYSATEVHTFTEGTCICGAVEAVAPAEVSVKIGHAVSFDSDLKMVYRIKLENIASAVPNYVTEGAYLVVEKDQYPAAGGVTVETVTLQPDFATDSARMLFNLGGIQSVEMGSELRAVLHIFDADGNEYVTPVDTYSVLAYAELCFDTYTYETQPELLTMLIDSLNYGSAAQVYFGRRTDVPVNAGLDAYQQYASTALSAELTDSRTYVDNDRTITAVTAMGFSVTFADKTEMNAKLTIAEGYTKDDITCVRVLDASGNVVDTLTDFTELTDGRLQVTYYGVKSIQMRDMFYFVAYVGDRIASQNVGYSVEAYAKSNVGSTNAALADMALKCIYYGDSAYAYFNR